ncbi:uncharacterized protein HGUI_02382 [Hanseniaspora guilliermondii]|uniref:NDT80 domain-containing protein n=1 Tax=Hanseniaspora guilliermondii TaxID=56406 RepID=A0A1L0FKS1_9ASCO|nr:uncharacterized protein HGUI_02382 [Hanseniaspora guilliermondii]
MNINQIEEEIYGMINDLDDIPGYASKEPENEYSHNKKTIYDSNNFSSLNNIGEVNNNFSDSNTKISYTDVMQYQLKSKKTKIAPRSSLQFKLGPPYQPQHHHMSVYSLNSGLKVTPILTARIDRGFDNVQDNWIGYKRNYFTSVASFLMYSDDLITVDDFIQDKYYVKINGVKKEILYFATRLVASCCEDNKEMNLVQHTAKRDKGPQIRPPIHPIIPGILPSHEVIRDASNIKNDSKKKKYDTDFYLHKGKLDLEDMDPNAIIHQYPADDIIKVARYERVQFCSSINQKRPTNVVKHFKLTTVLGAVVLNDPLKTFYGGDGLTSPILIDGQKTFIPVISTNTPELIIRGRSPSNYPPNMTESQVDQIICGDKSYKRLFTERQSVVRKRDKKGYVKKEKKRESIKCGKKITNPPVLVSSRPTTGNVTNILSPMKESKMGDVGMEEARLEDEGVKSLQDEGIQFMLGDCNDTGEIEKLIYEHIIKDNEQEKDGEDCKDESKDIDDELLLDMDKFENDKLNKHNAFKDYTYGLMKEDKGETFLMGQYDGLLEEGIPEKSEALVKKDYMNMELYDYFNYGGLDEEESKLGYVGEGVYGFEGFDDMIDVKNMSPRRSGEGIMNRYKMVDEKNYGEEAKPRSMRDDGEISFDKCDIGDVNIQKEMFGNTNLGDSMDCLF